MSFVYAPILGLFLARLGKGRTIREFVWMNIFAPSVFCILWIGAWARPVIASASVAKEKKTAKRKKALSILPCGSVESSAKIVLSMPLA